MTLIQLLEAAEKLAIKEYSACVGNRQVIMQHYIKILEEQGITHVDIWSVPFDATNDSEVQENIESSSNQLKN